MPRSGARRKSPLLLPAVLTLALGATWIVVDRILTAQYPEKWGGPNIGGGALLLLAYALVVTGLGLLAAAALGQRRRRHAQSPDRPHMPDEPAGPVAEPRSTPPPG